LRRTLEEWTLNRHEEKRPVGNWLKILTREGGSGGRAERGEIEGGSHRGGGGGGGEGQSRGNVTLGVKTKGNSDRTPKTLETKGGGG